MCTPISASSKIVQLLTILRARNAESVSPLTWFISAFTNLSKFSVLCVQHNLRKCESNIINIIFQRGCSRYGWTLPMYYCWEILSSRCYWAPASCSPPFTTEVVRWSKIKRTENCINNNLVAGIFREKLTIHTIIINKHTRCVCLLIIIKGDIFYLIPDNKT